MSDTVLGQVGYPHLFEKMRERARHMSLLEKMARRDGLKLIARDFSPGAHTALSKFPIHGMVENFKDIKENHILIQEAKGYRCYAEAELQLLRFDCDVAEAKKRVFESLIAFECACLEALKAPKHLEAQHQLRIWRLDFSGLQAAMRGEMGEAGIIRHSRGFDVKTLPPFFEGLIGTFPQVGRDNNEQNR